MIMPKGAEIIVSEDIGDADFVAVANACQEFNFAVIRNAIPQGLRHPVGSEIMRMTQCADNNIGWRKVFHEGDGTDWGTHRRDSYIGSLQDIFPNVCRLSTLFMCGIVGAAQKQQATRVDLGNTFTSDIGYVNTLPRNGTVARHHDADQQGIIIVFDIAGCARTRLSTSRNETLADFVVKPNDAIVLPAVVGSRGGPDDQAWHEVENVTPFWQNHGIRRSYVTDIIQDV